MTRETKILAALLGALCACSAWSEEGARARLRDAQHTRASIVAKVAKCAKRSTSDVTVWMAPSFQEPGLHEPGFAQSYLRRPEVAREFAAKQAMTPCWTAQLYQAAIEASIEAARAQADLFGPQAMRRHQ